MVWARCPSFALGGLIAGPLTKRSIAHTRTNRQTGSSLDCLSNPPDALDPLRILQGLLRIFGTHQNIYKIQRFSDEIAESGRYTISISTGRRWSNDHRRL